MRKILPLTPNEYNNIINCRLKELDRDFNNVYYIDRNVPFKSKNKYIIFKDDSRIFEDQIHYSALGGSIVGKYIMEQVLRDNVKN